jgi:hypothetical protein
MDEIPTTPMPTEKRRPGLRDIYMATGQFGFVSESGMFLKQKTKHTNGEVAETKIDMPWSYIVQNFETESAKPEGGIQKQRQRRGVTVRRVDSERPLEPTWASKGSQADGGGEGGGLRITRGWRYPEKL